MILKDLPVEEIALANMPFYHKIGAQNGNAYIRCGQVKRGGNEPYCYTEEKQCTGHICRVLSPGKTCDKALVIRDDGTVWSIYLSVFKEVSLLYVDGRRPLEL